MSIVIAVDDGFDIASFIKKLHKGNLDCKVNERLLATKMDLDTYKYEFIYSDGERVPTDKLSPHFPHNFKPEFEKLLEYNQYDIIIVPVDRDIFAMLNKLEITFTVIYPSDEFRIEYMGRPDGAIYPGLRGLGKHGEAMYLSKPPFKEFTEMTLALSIQTILNTPRRHVVLNKTKITNRFS